MPILLLVLSSCSPNRVTHSSPKEDSNRLNTLLRTDMAKEHSSLVVKDKQEDDAIAVIWLRRSFSSLGTSSFMDNYNHFKKRVELLDNEIYNINMHELIYYHYVTIGNADSARVYLNKAFDYFVTHGKEKAAYTLPTYYLLMLIRQNQTKEALDRCQYYLGLAKASGSKENVGRCYELSANIYKEIQMYSLAIPAYEKYIEIAKEATHPDTGIYNDINALAEINFFVGDYEKMNEELILFDSLMNNENFTGHLTGTIAVWNALKANYFLKKSNKDSAEIYIENMRDMYSNNIVSNHLDYETEIRYNEFVGNYGKALAYSDTLLQFYQQEQASRRIGNAQLIQARLNNKLGNYKAASANYAAYILSKDSLDTADLQKQAIAMQSSKEVADAQLAEGEVKQKLAENQNITLWVFVIGLLLVGALLLFLLTYYVRNQYRLKEYNTKLRAALNRAEEGVRVKENFMHHISHEIRTPLNAIIGFSSIIDEMYPEDKGMHQYLKVINENGEKLIDVITGILNASDLQNTMISETFVHYNISDIVIKIIDDFRPKVSPDTEIKYESTLPDDFKMSIRFDSITMLLNGIIGNAVKYTKSGTILIKDGLDETNTNLILIVEDTGIGVDESDADNIFNLFFKENKYELGGGIGLFVSQQVAEGHGGTLVYDKEYKEGARFILTLPLEF